MTWQRVWAVGLLVILSPHLSVALMQPNRGEKALFACSHGYVNLKGVEPVSLERPWGKLQDQAGLQTGPANTYLAPHLALGVCFGADLQEGGALRQVAKKLAVEVFHDPLCLGEEGKRTSWTAAGEAVLSSKIQTQSQGEKNTPRTHRHTHPIASQSNL